MHIGADTSSNGLQECQEKPSYFPGGLEIVNGRTAHPVPSQLTEIRRASAASERSFEARTRVLASSAMIFSSRIAIAGIHGSETLVSRMTIARSGGIQSSCSN